MDHNIKAHKVCENLLNKVKHSKFNYLVNETPYSVFITIRKKFTKEHQDLPNVTLAQEVNVATEDLKKENNLLHLKCKNLQNEIESVKNQNCTLKDSLANYKNENIAITQKLFILKGELSIQSENIEQEQTKVDSILKDMQSLENKLKEAISSDNACPQIMSCKQCDFIKESKKGLKKQMGRMYKVECKTCHEKFARETKLKTHRS